MYPATTGCSIRRKNQRHSLGRWYRRSSGPRSRQDLCSRNECHRSEQQSRRSKRRNPRSLHILTHSLARSHRPHNSHFPTACSRQARCGLQAVSRPIGTEIGSPSCHQMTFHQCESPPSDTRGRNHHAGAEKTCLRADHVSRGREGIGQEEMVRRVGLKTGITGGTTTTRRTGTTSRNRSRGQVGNQKEKRKENRRPSPEN